MNTLKNKFSNYCFFQNNKKSLSFYKPCFRFIVTSFLFFMCFTFFGCNNFLPLPDITSSVDTNYSSEKKIAAPLNVTASHGQKQQITISWTPVSNANLYFIYRADTPYSEFVQIDEATRDESSKVISVPAGYSGYFKVAAITGLGEISDFSLYSYGTSLATPIITDIQQDEKDSSATVYWYMENLSEKSYINSIRFLVTCYNQDGSIKEQKNIASTDETFYTFNQLDSSTLYRYDVEAYLITAQNSSEKSPKVDKFTAVSLVPQVAEFTASCGSEKDEKITLKIKLPKMAKTISSDAKDATGDSEYEDKPIYFKIQRFNDSEDKFEDICPYLSFQGSTIPLTKDAADFSLYQENNEISWSDTNVKRGIKYKYRVLSYIDNYFEKDGTTRKNITHNAAKANEVIGWVANIPSISSKQIAYTESPINQEEPDNEKYISSASTKITATWNALGKEKDYAFLLVQKHFKLKKDNGDIEDTEGSLEIIKPSSDRYCFTDISQLNDFQITYNFEPPIINDDNSKTDSPTNAQIRGYYKYSVYVVPISLSNSSDENEIRENAIVFAEDSSRRLIINERIANPEIQIEYGYKNKAIISFKKEENSTYKLLRETLDEKANVISTETKTINLSGNSPYSDETLEPGKAYQYTLYTSTESLEDIPSSTVQAFTLGKPELKFDETTLDYSTITLRWNSVIHPLEEKIIENDSSKDQNVMYTITVNGETYQFNQNDLSAKSNEDSIETENYSLKVINKKEYILQIKKNLPNFDYSTSKPKIAAENAGKDFDVKISVTNKFTNSEPNNQNDMTIKARTLGPANTNVSASRATDIKNITVTWNKIPSVNYYVVKRICPPTSEGEEPKEDLIYITKDGTATQNGEIITKNRTVAVLSSDATKFILTDQYCEASDKTNAYQVNQSKIIWGLEYEYTVFPVLSVDDNPYEDFDKVEFTNCEKLAKKGCTPGYALAINATKADSPDSVKITWEKPNTFESSQPSLWYKKEGSPNSDWKGPFTYDKSTKEAELNLDDLQDLNTGKTLRDQKVEFAVSYENNNSANFQPSYLEYLASKKDSYQEQNNVGYQFTLSTFNVTQPISTAETFSETINWSSNQNGTRKRGVGDGINGDCFEIQILNKNCSNKWYTIVTLSKEGKCKPIPPNEQPDWYDIDIADLGNNSMRITPKNVSDSGGVHNGLLKVQRDYKHYYRLVAKRKTSDDEEIKAVLGDFNSTLNDDTAKKPVIGIRKISGEEFAKCVTLCIADAFNQSGGSKTTIDSPKGKGTLSTTYKYDAKVHYNFSYEFKNYQNNFTTSPAGSSILSDFVINCKSTSDGCAYNDINYSLGDNNNFAITHLSGLPSYQGNVKISAGEHKKSVVWKATIEYKNNATSSSITKTITNNKDEFLRWIPYELGMEIKDRNDGTNKKFPTMQSSWFEVRE